MKTAANLPETPNRDLIAAELSIIPGLGQLYKGHYLEAGGIFLASLVLAGWAGLLGCLGYAALAFLGHLGAPVGWLAVLLTPYAVYFGLLPLLLFWAAVAWEAYSEPDLH